MSFIFFLLLIFLFFALFVVSSILRFFGAIFHIGRHNKNGNETREEEPDMKASRKVFTKEEGEYVDFEEIKEDEMNQHNP
jgi:hypothetical protein